MSTVTVQSKARIMPEALINLYEATNSLTRIIRKGCEGTERLVDGVDEITTIMLAQQRQRLLAEFGTPPQATA